MADPKPEDMMKLSAEDRTRLEAMDKQIKIARRGIATLKKLDVDTTAMEDKLVWAENVRKTLLEEFK